MIVSLEDAEFVSDTIEAATRKMAQNDFAGAIADLDVALSRSPTLPHAHNNRAHALLSLGRYHEGFQEFEFRLPLLGDPMAGSGIPFWRGEDLAGKRLLLCHEYGFGDTLMLLRYVPVLKGLGADVTLLIPASIERIAASLRVEIWSQYPQQSAAAFDYRCPMFSVVAGLHHGVADIPPFKIVPPWSPRPYRETIGIAWSGNRQQDRNQERSIDLDQFLGLLNSLGRRLLSVQNSDHAAAVKRGVAAPEYADFFHTASTMMALDHVVAVDTSPAHVAGLIEHPSAHVVVPFWSDWRWYRPGVWYPKIKVHRQQAPGDWQSAFESVNRAIAP